MGLLSARCAARDTGAQIGLEENLLRNAGGGRDVAALSVNPKLDA